MQGTPLRTWNAPGGISVCYADGLDGGGTYLAAGFLELFKRRRIPQQGRIFEWCAGPGFIGFALLGAGYCRSLCLADVFPSAVDACKETIAANSLSERASVYLSDNLASIPADEQWNAVVSNPPHFADVFPEDDRLRFDKDWGLHRAFFRDIDKFLAPSGVVILQENNWGSTPETFAPMIEAAGLKTVFVENALPERTADTRIYYMGVMRKSDQVPY
jgi:methylase of polypeptide subunit release factors